MLISICLPVYYEGLGEKMQQNICVVLSGRLNIPASSTCYVERTQKMTVDLSKGGSRWALKSAKQEPQVSSDRLTFLRPSES